jgi:hypothetical protein
MVEVHCIAAPECGEAECPYTEGHLAIERPALHQASTA